MQRASSPSNALSALLLCPMCPPVQYLPALPANRPITTTGPGPEGRPHLPGGLSAYVTYPVWNTARQETRIYPAVQLASCLEPSSTDARSLPGIHSATTDWRAAPYPSDLAGLAEMAGLAGLGLGDALGAGLADLELLFGEGLADLCHK